VIKDDSTDENKSSSPSESAAGDSGNVTGSPEEPDEESGKGSYSGNSRILNWLARKGLYSEPETKKTGEEADSEGADQHSAPSPDSDSNSAGQRRRRLAKITPAKHVMQRLAAHEANGF